MPAVIIAHGASGDAFKADVTGAYASVFGGEVFARMQPADRKTLVFEGNAEPLSLFCADESDGESLRACEQTNESLYRYDGANVGAGPGHGVHAERRLQDLDLQAPRRRQVPQRRRRSTPTTSSPATRSSGTPRTRCTRAAPACSTTGRACGAASSTRPEGNAAPATSKPSASPS